MVDTSRILKTPRHISRLYVKNYRIHIHTHSRFPADQTVTESKCFQIERNNALNNCCLPPLSFIRHANGSEATVVAFNYESVHLGESQEVMREWLGALLVVRNGELACRLSN